jgi:hypothetical protein
MRPSRTLYIGLNVHQDSIAVADVVPSLIPQQAGMAHLRGPRLDDQGPGPVGLLRLALPDRDSLGHLGGRVDQQAHHPAVDRHLDLLPLPPATIAGRDRQRGAPSQLHRSATRKVNSACGSLSVHLPLRIPSQPSRHVGGRSRLRLRSESQLGR